MIDHLRELQLLLTQVYKGPLDQSSVSLHNARIHLKNLILEVTGQLAQQRHGERVVARQKQNG